MQTPWRMLILLILWALVWGPEVVPDLEQTGLLYVVELHDSYFDPPGLLLHRGDRVSWLMVSRDPDGHSATAYHPQFDKQLRIPETAQPWNSGLLKREGQTFERAFNEKGVYDYFCIPHEDTGMVARIIVEEAIGPGTQSLAQGVSAAGQSVMPTVTEIMGLTGKIFNVQAQINTVALQVRRNNRAGAVQLWDEIAKTTQASELWARVRAVGYETALLQSFYKLRQLITSTASLSTILAQTQTLKDLLDEVSRKL